MGRSSEEIISEIQQKINNKKRLIAEKRNNEKKQKLISFGFYDKVYSDSDAFSLEYPLVEHVNNEYKRYKIVPKEISDEEWNQLIKIEEELNSLDATVSNSSKENKTSVFLFCVGVIMFLFGTIGFIGLISNDSIAMGFIVLFSALLFGSILIGLSEIINLLVKDGKNKSNE